MEKTIIICGFCPEITRGGAFELGEILKRSPRVLASDENPHYKDSPRTEIGHVTGIKQGYFFRNNYFLETSGEKVPLEFGRRDAENPNDTRTPRVILSLPDNHFFGKEIFSSH